MSNLRYPCLYFSQYFEVCNNFYVQSTTTGISSHSCRRSALVQVWPQDLNGFHRKSNSHLWKTSLPLHPMKWLVSEQLYCREKEEPLNFPRVSLNHPDNEITSFFFLQSSTSCIMQPPSPLIHTTVSSLPREQRRKSPSEKAVFDHLIKKRYPHDFIQVWRNTSTALNLQFYVSFQFLRSN